MEQKVENNVQEKENKACNCTKKINSLEKEIKSLKGIIDQLSKQLATIKKSLKK